jgi:hypothetical protein
MLWATRKRIQVNRLGTAWLIRRFIDPAAEFRFVEPDQVAAVQAREGAIGFDAPGATYPHADAQGRCSFEALVEKQLAHDPVLVELARIVHGADFDGQESLTPESAGLMTISRGLPLVMKDDEDTLAHAFVIYDALYASLAARRQRSNQRGG